MSIFSVAAVHKDCASSLQVIDTFVDWVIVGVGFILVKLNLYFNSVKLFA